MQNVPGVEEGIVVLLQAGLLDGGLQGAFEGVPLGGHLSHPWVIDGDAVIECLLGVIDAVGVLPQSGMRGQDDEAAGLDGRAERAEDPLSDQQNVQVLLT